MIKKVVMKRNVKNFDSVKENLAFWLSKTPEERVEVVEYSRRQLHGNAISKPAAEWFSTGMNDRNLPGFY